MHHSKNQLKNIISLKIEHVLTTRLERFYFGKENEVFCHLNKTIERRVWDSSWKFHDNGKVRRSQLRIQPPSPRWLSSWCIWSTKKYHGTMWRPLRNQRSHPILPLETNQVSRASVCSRNDKRLDGLILSILNVWWLVFCLHRWIWIWLHSKLENHEPSG